MCGRFTSTSTPDQLAQFFDTPTPTIDLDQRYNIAPTTPTYTVINHENRRTIETMRWGLLPRWAKDQTGRPLFNAKAETIATKNAFARSFQQRRCLIPADGFYEWTTKPDGTKQPHYITHRDQDPLAFAAIWRTWHQPNADTALDTCSVITCRPNKIMAPIHDRMPVILPPSVWTQWLSPKTSLTTATDMLKPAPNELLKTYQVSTEANSARNDHPGLIEPLAP